jgi:uncharacterized membrane protein
MPLNSNRKLKYFLGRLVQYFFQGLIVILPIGITVWVIFAIFFYVDGFLPNLINWVVPGAIKKDALGNLRDIPAGVGFAVAIILVLFIGWLSSLLFVGKVMELIDKALEHTPGIKYIYSPVKDFLEAFAGNKKKFDKPVLACIDDTDVWRIGFITQADMSEFEMPDHVSVYVPLAYAVTGITYIVPKSRIKVLKDISAADAMKFAVTGGVTDIDDD